jgi:cell division protein FtsB
MKKNNKIKNMNEYKKGKKNKHKKKRNVKIKKKISIFLISISIVGILIGSMCGYTVVSDLKYDIHYLKQDLRKEQVRLEELKAKVDTDKSIQEIEKKAKEELGMDYPTKSQTRYIEVEK